MNTAQRIIKNTAFLLISRIIVLFLNLVAVIYLARILGPSNFGKVNFAIAIVVYFTLIAHLGLPVLGTREVARESDRIKEYVGSILTLRLCLAILSFVLLLVLTFFLNKPLEIKYLLILYGLGIISSTLFLDWAFQGVERMEYIGLGRVVACIFYLGLVFWFIKGPAGLLLIPCFDIAARFLAATFLIIVFVRKFGRPKFRFNLVFYKNLLRRALPIGAVFIMSPIFLYTDTVMLGFMRSNEEIGYYNAASKIILALVMLGIVYQDAIFPILSKYYKTSLDLLRKLQSYSAKIIVATALPVAIGITILAKPIMNLLYGANYGPGVIALKILIWYFVIEYTYSIFSRGLIACDREKERLRIIAILVVGNVIFNLILIPLLGLMGAAIATVLARIIGFFLLRKEFSKIISIPIQNYVLKPLLASLVMGFFIYLGLNGLNLNVFILIFGGAGIYSTLLYVIRGITREEMILIRSTFWQTSNIRSRQSN